MSFKIQLQELCQKQNDVLPKYLTEYVGGEDHAPKWKSFVFVYEDSYEGAIRSRKKDAENSAAQEALRNILSSSIGEENSKQPLILIDLENQGDSIEFLREYEFDAADVWGIASQGHPILDKVSGLIVTKEIPTTVSDGADIGLCVLAARAMEQYSQLIVVSNDHFAVGLQECLSGMFGHDVHVVGSLKELY